MADIDVKKMKQDIDVKKMKQELSQIKKKHGVLGKLINQLEKKLAKVQ